MPRANRTNIVKITLFQQNSILKDIEPNQKAINNPAINLVIDSLSQPQFSRFDGAITKAMISVQTSSWFVRSQYMLLKNYLLQYIALLLFIVYQNFQGLPLNS
jgi:hypothetical protein